MYIDSNTYLIHISECIKHLRTGVSSSIEGVGKPVVKIEEAKLIVTFPTLPLPVDAPYWVLDTDYTSYAVVWSCSNFGVFRWVILGKFWWLFSLSSKREIRYCYPMFQHEERLDFGERTEATGIRVGESVSSVG